MGRTSTKPLAVQKTIERKQKPRNHKHVRAEEVHTIEESNNPTHQPPGQDSVQQRTITSSQLLPERTQAHQSDPRRLGEDEESRSLLALLILLERGENAWRCTQEETATLDLTVKEVAQEASRQIEARDENGNPRSILSLMDECEMMSGYQFFKEDEFMGGAGEVVEDELASCIRELQEQEGDTLPGRNYATGALVEQGIIEDSEMLPLSPGNRFDEDNVEDSDGAGTGETQILKGNNNYPLQDWVQASEVEEYQDEDEGDGDESDEECEEDEFEEEEDFDDDVSTTGE